MKTGSPPNAMITTVRRMCEALSDEHVTVGQIAALLGTPVEDQGAPLAVVVRPTDTAWQEGQVVRAGGTEEPAFVDLSVASGQTLTVSDLKEAFGSAQTLPQLHWDSPRTLLFTLDNPTRPYTCAIIAQAGPDPASASVNRVTVRRDPRLAG